MQKQPRLAFSCVEMRFCFAGPLFPLSGDTKLRTILALPIAKKQCLFQKALLCFHWWQHWMIPVQAIAYPTDLPSHATSRCTSVANLKSDRLRKEPGRMKRAVSSRALGLWCRQCKAVRVWGPFFFPATSSAATLSLWWEITSIC